MAHRKLANAMVTHPRISQRGWGGIRRVASSGVSGNLSDQAREILGGSLDPDKYLFTHCTIVASVDTERVPNVRLGKVREGSDSINRKYSDYHITPSSSMFVNNNGDSWSRQVLLASYPTFIGGQNFLEHVQIEEKSKGRIIDAVARDIGDSVYVDILVATNRKHASLIGDIESGKMSTLSMGCTTDFTICTKCGHVAVDETELCSHVRYEKLNTFMDDQGQRRVVAELCGHQSHNDNGGVRFIEASWVAVPAFQGAVLNKILTASQAPSEKTLRKVLSAPTPSWSDFAISKAASGFPLRNVRAELGAEEDLAPPDEDPAPEADSAPEDKGSAPFGDLEDDVYTMIKDRVKSRIKGEISQSAPDTNSDWTNDTIIKEGAAKSATMKTAYRRTMATLVRTAASDVALVEGVAQLDRTFGFGVSSPISYRAALKAGSISNYPDSTSFVRACRKAAGRNLNSSELRVVIRVGTLLSQRERLTHTP